MGILEILTIIFTVLRGLGFTDWPWVCCFIPEMIAVAIYAVCIAVYVYEQKQINKIEKEIEKLLKR